MTDEINDLVGSGGELRASIQITRKVTRLTETYELVGQTTPEEHEQLLQTEE